ncbi:putative pectinesterase 63 [Rutidosis leptorrhynchoides]|uniref:putative pectinesterase 63 n=1 Tax=Rutidosis leptorrhynchoides TaxID=125765 RepID=UPI003A99D6AB
MAIKRIAQIHYVATILFALAFLALPLNVFSDDKTPAPAEKGKLDAWFSSNIAKKDAVNETLAAAEKEAAKVIKVRTDGSGDFKTVMDAIKSIPSGNTKRVVVDIGSGVYKEKIKIERTQPFVTLYGSPKAMPNLTFNGDAAKYGTVDSATLIVEGDYFVAVNLNIVNSSPKPDGKRKGAQAAAIRVSGDKNAFFNCKFFGFQDTVCDDRGHHLFKDCYIEGTVDFIFGDGKSLYLNTELNVIEDRESQMTVITANARDNANEESGFSFVHCKVGGTGNGTYLGRAWMESPQVVFAFTEMTGVVNPEGWSDNRQPSRDKTIFYGEYQCSGAGSSLDGRVKYSKQLTETEVQPFISLGFIQGSSWLLPPPSL